MKKRTKGVLAAALAAAGVFLLAGLDARLLVRAYTVESGRLTGPVRLAVLTDLHACAYGVSVVMIQNLILIRNLFRRLPN